MNILTDILSLWKRKKFVTQALPEDVLVLGVNAEPDIEGIASPIPYKDVKLIKISDFIDQNECLPINVPIEVPTINAGVFRDKTTDPLTGECYINFRRLKSISLNLSITENGDFIDFDVTAESNTASNIGGGVEVYESQVGVDFQFRTFTSVDGSVTITQNLETIDLSGGIVNSVTGLNTDNADPANPIVQISVGPTLSGDGTPGSPLESNVPAQDLADVIAVDANTGFIDIIVNTETNPDTLWAMETDNSTLADRIALCFIDNAGGDFIKIGQIDPLNKTGGQGAWTSIGNIQYNYLNATDFFSFQIDSNGFLASASGAASGNFTIVNDLTFQIQGVGGLVNLPALPLTATRTQSFQDNDGIIALVDDIAVTSLTTTGTSGASTLVSGVLNVPNYAGGGAIITENVVYVAINGSDATGVRNELSNPFLTLEAAVAVALAGDLIVVYPGQYNVTTTALNGIAKDGVSYYFYPETTVNKATIGDIFNINGFVTGFNVYGQGDFSKTADAGNILWVGVKGTYSLLFDMTFETRDVFNSSASFSFTCATEIQSARSYPNLYKLTLKFRNVLCTGGGIFSLTEYGHLDIEAISLKSTAGNVLIQQTNGNNWNYTINASYVESTSSIAIQNIVYTNRVAFNINWCVGVSFAYSFNAFGRGIINGYASGIYMIGNGVLVTHNGQCRNLVQLSGSFAGNQVNVANIGGGVSSFELIHDYYPTTLTQSGGEANVTLLNENVTSYSMLITGGKLNVIGFVENDQDYVNVVINGITAEVVWNVRVLGSTFFGVYSTTLCYITLTEGILRLQNVLESRITTSSDASCIAYNGGTLIIDGGTLITANPECPVIRVGGADRNIKVLSAGLSSNRTENGGTLSAKKYKSQFTVSAVASTRIDINGTSIIETDVATYNTIPLLAQRMTALINADPTTSALVDATQDTGGTDVYFYLEADTAGTIITITGLINLVELSLRQNSFALTNITLGPILENINVE